MKAMSEHELLQTMSANTWAEQFMLRFGENKAAIDLDVMLGWFANAIMSGYDHAMRRKTNESNT